MQNYMERIGDEVLEHLFIMCSIFFICVVLAKFVKQKMEKSEKYDFMEKSTNLNFYNIKGIKIGYYGFEGNRLILFNSAKVVNQTFISSKGVYKVTVKDAEGQIVIDIPHYESVYFNVKNRKSITHIFLLKKWVADTRINIGFSTYKKGSFSGYSIKKMK